MNQANFHFDYEVITMIIVLVTTKEKLLGTNFNQQNWMLVIWLKTNTLKTLTKYKPHCFLCWREYKEFISLHCVSNSQRKSCRAGTRTLSKTEKNRYLSDNKYIIHKGDHTFTKKDLNNHFI